MGRQREGLDGKQKENNRTFLDDYFDEINQPKEDSDESSKTTGESIKQPTTKPVGLDEASDIIKKLPKKQNTPSIQPKIKGGKLKITPTVEEVKLTKADFIKLNENGLYNLQKKTRANSSQLATKLKSVSMRPDLLEIFKTVSEGEYGLQTKLINNALIYEFIRIGILDESSLTEILDY